MSYGIASYGEITYAEDSEFDGVYNDTISENLTVADTLATDAVLSSTLTDIFNLDDSVPPWEWYDTLTDIFSIDDTLSSKITWQEIMSETINLNDLYGDLQFLTDGYSLDDATSDHYLHKYVCMDMFELTTFCQRGWIGSPVDGFNISDDLTYKVLGFITEQISLDGTLTSSGIFNVVSLENVETGDTLYITFPISVLEDLTVDDTVAGIRQLLVSLLSGLTVDDLLGSYGIFLTAQGEYISLADAVSLDSWEALLDALTVDDAVDIQRLASVLVLDSTELSAILGVNTEGLLEAIEGFVLDDSNVTQQVGPREVQDEVVVTHVGDHYEVSVWVMNPENYAVSNYSFGFTEGCVFGQDHLFADETGLYLLGGERDVCGDINSVITTAAMDFGSTNMKQVPSVLLGTNGTDLVLEVSIDGDATARYEVCSLPDNLETKQIKVGKGLVGHNWQFTLMTADNSQLDLDSFEFYPIVLKRKHNG